MILICMSLFLLSGCEEEVKEPTEITFIHGWGSTEADHVAMRQIYADFEKENPDIHLNMLSMPTNTEMIHMVEDMLTTGEVPDIVFTAGEGEDSIYDFMVKHDMLVDLMPYLKEDDAFKEDISPIILDNWTTEKGELFTATDVLILSGGYWYNKDIFEAAGIKELPATWEDFYKMLDSINTWATFQGNGVEAIRPSIDAYLYMTDNYLAAEGVDLEKVRGDLPSQDLQGVFNIWEQTHSYVNKYYKGFHYRDELDMFNNEKLAIFFNGVWGASMIKPDIKVGYALIPSDAIHNISNQSAALGYLLGNSENQEKMDASVRFLKYMLSEEVQKRILLETQQMPSNPKIVISDYYATLERFCLAVERIQLANKRINIPNMLWTQGQKDTIENNINDFFDEKLSREEFVELLRKAS